ncbi:hypothetical protein [Clostridium massiliodielmoense]|uniref:hypothetical protein n=1 Tax=Clostridium massiliodielmoense TaxID=1776385 RepID=UPI0004D69544|nr:hypothetical protein [Clostridium massiliodielmoense]KEH92312.1 hypothetical protein Z962_12245 [Clostridium botulinum C/D str. BKT12695]
MANYKAVTNLNQGIFNSPRQKMWAVMNNSMGWRIELITNSFDEAKEKAREFINKGGSCMSIDSIMVVEIVPIDTVISPSI